MGGSLRRGDPSAAPVGRDHMTIEALERACHQSLRDNDFLILIVGDFLTLIVAQQESIAPAGFDGMNRPGRLGYRAMARNHGGADGWRVVYRVLPGGR
jgi:hypothetical protein